MSAKLRTEAEEYNFVRGIAVQLLITFVISRTYLNVFQSFYTDGCMWEYVIFVLNRYHYILVLYPIIFLVMTCSKHNEVCRYPVLIRYKSRNEFFNIRLLVKMGLALLNVLSLLALLLLTGRKLALDSKHDYLSTEKFGSIIAGQCLNIFCYLCVMLLLYEVLRSIINNTIKNLVITSLLPVANLVIVKLHLTQIVLWTPWGNIAYKLDGNERAGYHFYWWYWLFVLLFIYYLATVLNSRKDYIFEKNC